MPRENGTYRASGHFLNVHAQPMLLICAFMHSISEGFDETAQMHMLLLGFTRRLCHLLASSSMLANGQGSLQSVIECALTDRIRPHLVPQF